MGTPARVHQDRAVITEPAKRRARKGPPRPRAHPVLGSALDLRRSQTETYARVMREHGDVVRLAAGLPGLRIQVYCVFHPDGVRQVLAGSRDGYTKRNRFYVQIAEALGWGLLTTEGERWQRQRRLIQPLFTRKQIAGYANLMAGEAAAVARRWESAARDGAGVDAHAEMVRLTLRVVGRSIFGDEVEPAVAVLNSAFPVLNRYTFRRAMSPVATPASWPTPGNRQAARARQALYSVVDELIARRVQAGAGGQDLVSRLLNARDADPGEPIDVQQVCDEALIFLLAGYETTSTALTFALHLLGRHPAEQARIHDELDAVMGAGRRPRPTCPRCGTPRWRSRRRCACTRPRVRHRPPRRSRDRDRRLRDPRGIRRPGEPVRHAPAPAVLARRRDV